MIRKLIFIALVSAIFQCCSSRLNSREMVHSYLSKAENGLMQVDTTGAIDYRVTFRPNVLAAGMEENKEVLLFNLEMTFNGQEPLTFLASDRNRFTEAIRSLSGSGNNLFIRSEEGSISSPLALTLDRTFGMSDHVRVLVSVGSEFLNGNQFTLIFTSPFDSTKREFLFESENIIKLNNSIEL